MDTFSTRLWMVPRGGRSRTSMLIAPTHPVFRDHKSATPVLRDITAVQRHRVVAARDRQFAYPGSVIHR